MTLFYMNKYKILSQIHEINLLSNKRIWIKKNYYPEFWVLLLSIEQMLLFSLILFVWYALIHFHEAYKFFSVNLIHFLLSIFPQTCLSLQIRYYFQTTQYYCLLPRTHFLLLLLNFNFLCSRIHFHLNFEISAFSQMIIDPPHLILWDIF